MQNNGNMEDRVSTLEILMELSAALSREMAASQERMAARQERMAARQQRMEENLQRMAEDLQYFDEELHLLEESGQRRDELLQQLLQGVAVMQADIVRIDETHT